MLKKLFIINLIFVLLLTGFVSTSNAKNLYKNEEHRFRITFPEGWKVGKGSSADSVVIASDITGSSIGITVTKTDLNNTVDMLLENIPELIQGVQKKLEYIFSNIKLINKSETYISGRQMLITEYSGTLRHITTSSRMRILTYISVNNGNIFTITCGTGLVLYEDYKRIFMNSVSTLVFEDNTINLSSVGTTKESPVDYKNLEYFVNSVKKFHPDYPEIIYSQKFEDYVNNLPLQQFKTAIRIKGSGTSEEIIQLISNYKLQSDYQESHRSMIKDVIENYSVFDDSHAMNILQDWINNEEGNAKVIRLSVEDNSSNRFTQTYLIKYTIAKGSNQQKYMYEHNPHTKSTRKMVYLHEED